MNEFVPPHKLVNISMFEDEHDVDAGGNALMCVVHTAG
jgi:hypothetical protein